MTVRILLLLSILTSTTFAFAQQDTAARLEVANGSKGLAYKLNKKPVSSPNLLAQLGVLTSKTHDQSIMVIFSNGVTFDQANNTKGIIDKTGTLTPRFYVRYKGTNRLQEITFGKVISEGKQ